MLAPSATFWAQVGASRGDVAAAAGRHRRAGSLEGLDHGVALQALRQGNVALNERYPGSAHLFADSSLADYDPQAAELLMERVLAFLRENE